MDAPCELDRTNSDHVSAVHEAGHAVAIDRTGCVLRRLTLVKGARDRSHGTTERGHLHGLKRDEIIRRDRVIALAGPVAERLFNGEADDESCQNDEEFAASATAELGDDQDAVRAAVALALNEDSIWFAVLTTACEILRAGGFIRSPAGLQAETIRTLLGEPPPSWP